MTDALRISPPNAVADTPAVSTHTAAGPWWRTPPVDKRGLVLWIATFVVMTVVVAAIGLLVVHELGGIRTFDDRVARWLARHRTNTWDDLTLGGSFIADADVKIPATVILCGVFMWCWRRWTEPALLAGALALEVSIFILSSFVVDRPRPPIAHLDPIPPTGAFPSGHSAAAVAFYGAIAIIVCWHTRNRIARTIAIGAAFVVPLIVATSRMYRGMHHLSDVVVGLVIGLVSLGVTWLVVRNGPASQLEPNRHARHTGADAPVSSSTPSPATS
jgi:undecaprenyl-diphosphatase